MPRYLVPAYAPGDPRRARPARLGNWLDDLNRILDTAGKAKDLIFGNSSTQGKLDQAMLGTLDLAYSYAVAGDTTARPEFGNKSPRDYLSAVAAARAGDAVGQYAAAKLQQVLLQVGQAGFSGATAWVVAGLVGAVLLTLFNRPARSH